MNNPGVWNLGDQVITSALTGEVITDGVGSSGVAQEYINRLEGMLAATVEVRLSYGTGGTSVKAYVQTSASQGTDWCDVICATFTTASATKIFNLSGLTPKTTAVTPTDGTLTDDTCVDGVFGDRWRVKLTTTGVYSTNTSISVRLVAR